MDNRTLLSDFFAQKRSTADTYQTEGSFIAEATAKDNARTFDLSVQSGGRTAAVSMSVLGLEDKDDGTRECKKTIQAVLTTKALRGLRDVLNSLELEA